MKEYKYQTLILNSSHIVEGSKNSVFKYSFDKSLEFKNAQIAINTINIYFSWFNISSALNNNKFTYKWFDAFGELNETFQIVIKDGYYNINDLNEYVQSILVSRGHYLQHVSSGNYVYHFEFISNKAYYSVELNCYAMMTSEAAGADYIRGSTDWAFPSEYTTVQVILNSTNLFSSLIGFENGVYPEVSDENNHVFESSKAPIIDPISSVIVLCSFATQGGFSNPDNAIYSFTPGNISFGAMIEKTPVIQNYINIRDGVYSSFTIEFVNQHYRRININDPETVIMVNLKILDKE